MFKSWFSAFAFLLLFLGSSTVLGQIQQDNRGARITSFSGAERLGSREVYTCAQLIQRARAMYNSMRQQYQGNDPPAMVAALQVPGVGVWYASSLKGERGYAYAAQGGNVPQQVMDALQMCESWNNDRHRTRGGCAEVWAAVKYFQTFNDPNLTLYGKRARIAVWSSSGPQTPCTGTSQEWGCDLFISELGIEYCGPGSSQYKKRNWGGDSLPPGWQNPVGTPSVSLVPETISGTLLIPSATATVMPNLDNVVGKTGSEQDVCAQACIASYTDCTGGDLPAKGSSKRSSKLSCKAVENCFCAEVPREDGEVDDEAVANSCQDQCMALNWKQTGSGGYGSGAYSLDDALKCLKQALQDPEGQVPGCMAT
ncbi:hypothetical protein MMC12_000432 [Toensbergia leucococca]|nr:hypothetical protein [Toensbergia leucococca]